MAGAAGHTVGQGAEDETPGPTPNPARMPGATCLFETAVAVGFRAARRRPHEGPSIGEVPDTTYIYIPRNDTPTGYLTIPTLPLGTRR